MLVKAYGDNVFFGNNVQRLVSWCPRPFKDDNFDMSDKKRENRSGKIEDHEFLALLEGDVGIISV